MKITEQVKLLPASAHDADALAATLRACNRAANAASEVASEVAFAKDLKRRNVLQEAVYHRIKADFDLGAQVMTNLLQSHAHVDGVFAQNNEMAVRNAVRAVHKSEVDKQVKVPVKVVTKDNVTELAK